MAIVVWSTYNAIAVCYLLHREYSTNKRRRRMKTMQVNDTGSVRSFQQITNCGINITNLAMLNITLMATNTDRSCNRFERSWIQRHLIKVTFPAGLNNQQTELSDQKWFNSITRIEVQSRFIIRYEDFSWVDQQIHLTFSGCWDQHWCLHHRKQQATK